VEGRGRFRAFRPGRMNLYSQDLLLRSFWWSFGRHSILRSRGRIGGSFASRIGGIGGSFASRIGGIGGSINSWRHGFLRGRCRILGSLGSSIFLFATACTQHEGNRNGAPDLCIHRQLPQIRS